jgi:hypothetical protein
MYTFSARAVGDQYIFSFGDAIAGSFDAGAERASTLHFAGATDAIRFLMALPQEDAARQSMRGMLRDRGVHSGLAAMSDHEVMRQTAELMVSGLLRVVEIRRIISAGPATEEGEAPRAEGAAPRPPASRPPEDDSPTFNFPHDPVTQAKALQDAARNGVPFCEECARAAAGH